VQGNAGRFQDAKSSTGNFHGWSKAGVYPPQDGSAGRQVLDGNAGCRKSTWQGRQKPGFARMLAVIMLFVLKRALQTSRCSCTCMCAHHPSTSSWGTGTQTLTERLGQELQRTRIGPTRQLRDSGQDAEPCQSRDSVTAVSRWRRTPCCLPGQRCRHMLFTLMAEDSIDLINASLLAAFRLQLTCHFRAADNR
jgi:hypothetical protein